MRRSILLLSSAFALVLVAGCGQGGDSDEGSASGSGKSGLASCVVGTWEQDTASFAEMMEATMFAGMPDGFETPDLSFDGTQLTTFAEGGTFRSEVDMTMRMSMTVSEMRQDWVVTTAGTSEGTWKVEGDVLLTSITTDTTTTTTMVNGQKVDAGSNGLDLSAMPEGGASATCDRSTLTLRPDAADLPDGAPELLRDFAVTLNRK
ncbi:MAG: hypothetical protein FWD18_04095 [Micrococcales bacterium]|nr:hypothetical protein [Micrococcales bacterium]